MDWGEMAGREVKPFAGVCTIQLLQSTWSPLTIHQFREWVHKQLNSIWTANAPALEPPAVESSRFERNQKPTNSI